MSALKAEGCQKGVPASRRVGASAAALVRSLRALLCTLRLCGGLPCQSGTPLCRLTRAPFISSASSLLVSPSQGLFKQRRQKSHLQQSAVLFLHPTVPWGLHFHTRRKIL